MKETFQTGLFFINGIETRLHMCTNMYPTIRPINQPNLNPLCNSDSLLFGFITKHYPKRVFPIETCKSKAIYHL